MIEGLISRRKRAIWTVPGAAALAGVVYGIAVTGPGFGVRGRALAVAALTVLASAGWVGWIAANVVAGRPRVLAAALGTLVITGGLLAGIDPVSPALVFCGVGVSAAVADLRPAASVSLASAGIAVVAAGAVTFGEPIGRPAAYAGVLAAITLAGFNRRQYRTRLEQAEQLVVQTQRAQAGQARAAALDERSRMAREIHDVLAHSLGALVVQLDVADALLADGRDPGRAHDHVARARRLAVEGLAETRQAIGALRGDTPPLPVQLTALAQGYQADTGTPLALAVSGILREVRPDAALTAYRTAQEALSNARKHAPGAPVSIRLDYRDDGLVLTVADHPASGRAADPVGLAGTGGGYGLAGLAERSELIGGVLTAGPEESGWEVRLWLPA